MSFQALLRFGVPRYAVELSEEDLSSLLTQSRAVEIWVPGEQPLGQAPVGISWGLVGVLTPEGPLLPGQSCLVAQTKSNSAVLRPQRWPW